MKEKKNPHTHNAFKCLHGHFSSSRCNKVKGHRYLLTFPSHSSFYPEGFHQPRGSRAHTHTLTHRYTLCSAAAEHMSWCGSVQWWKWVDLDINSSSSLSAALIGFDIAQNHLVRAPAACSLLHLKYDWDDHLKCWRVCGSASRYTLNITTFIHSFDHCSFL